MLFYGCDGADPSPITKVPPIGTLEAPPSAPRLAGLPLFGLRWRSLCEPAAQQLVSAVGSLVVCGRDISVAERFLLSGEMACCGFYIGEWHL
jgi:hypothetical protein